MTAREAEQPDAVGRRGRIESLFTVDPGWDRRAALTQPAMLGIALLTAAYLEVLFHITDVVGGTGLLAVETVLVLVIGTALAARVDARTALFGSAAVLVAGMAVYYVSIPASQRALIDVGVAVRDFFALLSGLSVFRLIQAQIWALAVLPAPLLGSWVLALRGEFPLSTAVGGSALGLFVLTGDAGPVMTLVGVSGAALAVGLGELGPRNAITVHWDTVVLVVTMMIVLSTMVSVVPGGERQPILGGSATPTLEGNLVSNDDSVGVVGAIELSPEVRFTVKSERQSYWRVGSYDRYTGGSWVRTGESSSYENDLSGPPGESATVEQTITAETTLNSMPAIWKPVSVGGNVQRATQVTSEDGLQAAAAISPGESYSVTSEQPVYTSATLDGAGTDYPAGVTERYLGLPDSTPDRVGERTETVLESANASTPYDSAVAIEQYLESNNEYSLNVERPRGDVADSFLFEMDAGYCTYYATTMAVMLRTQGVPARVTTGYTSGERVSQDEWVVRGLDAHMWVEVYFPEVGWVAFDPTPGSDRETARNERIASARERGEAGVDIEETGPEDWTETPTETFTGGEVGDEGENAATTVAPGVLQAGRESLTPGRIGTSVDGTRQESEENGPLLPSREQVGYGLVLLFGGVAASRRFGLNDKLYRFIWLRYQPRSEPVTDVERAFARLETLFGTQQRTRRPGETASDYFDRLRVTDSRARQVLALYEEAHYGGAASEADAEAAIDAVDSLVAETTPILGRFR